MKKPIIFASLATLVMASCTSEEPMPQTEVTHESNSTVTESLSRTRTLDEAAKIATDAIGMLPQGDSRGAARTFRKENVKYGIALSKSRSGGNDTLMYVFNFDDEQGFAVVAADRAVDGLIAVTELGSYDPDVTPDNPGLADYMARAKTYISSNSLSSSDSCFQNLAQLVIRRDTISSEEVKPNFNLRWGQFSPEGIYFQNKIAGCTNVAIAMALSYFQTPMNPMKLALTYKNSQDTLVVKWAQIRQHHQSGHSASEIAMDGCDLQIHFTLSEIIREIAHRNKSTMDASGTGTYITDVFDALESLDLRSDGVLEYLPLAAMRNKAKVLVSGHNESNWSDIGHTWLLDGYKAYDVHVTEWIVEYLKKPVLHYDHGINNVRYYHFNWGNCGIGNGYFLANVYDDSKAAIPDKKSQSGFIYNYKYVKFIPLYNTRSSKVLGTIGGNITEIDSIK